MKIEFAFGVPVFANPGGPIVPGNSALDANVTMNIARRAEALGDAGTGRLRSGAQSDHSRGPLRGQFGDTRFGQTRLFRKATWNQAERLAAALPQPLPQPLHLLRIQRPVKNIHIRP